MMGVFMFGRVIRRIFITAFCFGAAGLLCLSGCSVSDTDNARGEALDYTVVESADVPVELAKLIEEKKGSTLRLTFTTKDYTYIVAGYGTMETSGYSIRVNDVYLADSVICADFTLIGPAASESVTETKTTPYIVVKIEKRDESIIFKL
ncbi:MAG: protease complex subunit PrcB family protein [Eubacteriales bacterium]|nr:protease complex subunit PrcB family protein [Eubacteriales bacterium]